MPLVIFIDDSKTTLALAGMAADSMSIEAKEYLQAEVALAEIKAGMKPDLIITDLNMPIMNGFEFFEELRKIESTKNTPCFILSSETKEEIKQQGKALGVTGWISKPFNIPQLQQIITRILDLK